MKEKFLTVFAVFDEKTQQQLKLLQNKILDTGLSGSQTMDIPFHISLGSFPVKDKDNIIQRIKKISKQVRPFNIELIKVNNFSGNVLFIEPELNDKLKVLQTNFNNNFADGLPWHAHVTIYIDDTGNFSLAEKILIKHFNPLKAEIVGIQMGEFFPTKMIIEEKFSEV